MLLGTALTLLIGCSELGKRAESEPFPDAFSLTTYDDQIAPATDINGLHDSFKNALDWYTHLRFEGGAMFHILGVESVRTEQILQLRHRLQALIDRLRLTETELEVAFADQALFIWSDQDDFLENQGWVDDFDVIRSDVLLAELSIAGSEQWLENSQDLSWSVAAQAVLRSRWEGENQRLELQAAFDTSTSTSTWLSQEHLRFSPLEQYAGVLTSLFYGEPSTFGEHTAVSRQTLSEEDPLGAAWISALAPPFIDFEVRIDPQFTGSFYARRETELSWTQRSQYFRNVKCQGEFSQDLYAGAEDHILRGNAADNLLNGGPGEDLIVVSGAQAEYDLETTSNGLLLFDSVQGRDGADLLQEIEVIRFSDGDYFFPQ